MLVLSRKIGEVITVGTSVKITVLSYDRGVIRLGIEAPKSIPVHRKEVFDKIIEMNKQAARTELSALKNALVRSKVQFSNEDAEKVQPPTLQFSSSTKINSREE
ncbi:MAG: carbon storage regulator CsrA [Candidatus Kapaibacterium sp.]